MVKKDNLINRLEEIFRHTPRIIIIKGYVKKRGWRSYFGQFRLAGYNIVTGNIVRRETLANARWAEAKCIVDDYNLSGTMEVYELLDARMKKPYGGVEGMTCLHCMKPVDKSIYTDRTKHPCVEGFHDGH